MEKKECLEFLNSCVGYLDHLSESEIESLTQIYKAEMEKECEKTDFEILMPAECFIPVYEDRKHISHFLSVENKKKFDYKTPAHKEITADHLECLAA